MSEPIPEPHDAAELRRRRRRQARERAQIRRRRALAGGGALAVLILLVVILTVSGGGGKGRASTPRTNRAQTVSPPKRVAGAQSAAEEAKVQAALKATIAANDYISRGTPRKKVVALTFDDGPSIYTQRLVDLLKRRKAPATFFVVGTAVKQFPELVQEELADGNVVGDHTLNHGNLRSMDLAGQKNEILGGLSAIQQATHGARVQLFRPPYGAFNDQSLALLKQAGLVMTLWSVDSQDYTRPGPDKIVYTVLSGTRAGMIVLMHDGGGDRSETLAAVPRIITALRRKGYRLVTVPELLTQDPVPANQPAPVTLSGG